MKKIFKRYVPLLAVLVMAVMLAACSSAAGNEKDAAATAAPASASPAQAAKTVYPLTIQNHTNNGEGTEWKANSQTFDKAPEKVVANTQGAAELLIKLGLTDKMVGVAALYGAGDPAVQEELRRFL